LTRWGALGAKAGAAHEAGFRAALKFNSYFAAESTGSVVAMARTSTYIKMQP
jgi:hypothetical protein